MRHDEVSFSSGSGLSFIITITHGCLLDFYVEMLMTLFILLLVGICHSWLHLCSAFRLQQMHPRFNFNTQTNHKDKIKNSNHHDLCFIRLISPTTTLQASSTIDADAFDSLGYTKAGYKSGFVTILGNPNVGKSSLLNALLQQKLCIVSSKPQTTRHRINGVITEDDFQIIFSDTPGMISTPSYKLQEAMMESVSGATNDADVVVVVTDLYAEEIADEKAFQKLIKTDRPVIVAVNKIDLKAECMDDIRPILYLPDKYKQVEGLNSNKILKKKGFLKSRVLMNRQRRNDMEERKKLDEEKAVEVNVPDGIDNDGDNSEGSQDLKNVDSFVLEYVNRIASEDFDLDMNARVSSPSKTIKSVKEAIEIWQSRLPAAEIVTMSVLQNATGVTKLLDRLVYHLPEGPKYFPDDEITNRDERFFTAEIIRESLFVCYQDEIPYSCEVSIESFKDKSPTLSVIEAVIWASKDTQKAILIGKNGNKLKELGTAARGKLEEFLNRKVFLSLRVKVDSDWRQSDESLKRYGYVDSDYG